MSIFIVRRVFGHSMQPTLLPGKIVLGTTLKRVKVGSVVIARWRNKDIIKRVAAMEGDTVMLRGDNKHDSLSLELPLSSIIGVKV